MQYLIDNNLPIPADGFALAKKMVKAKKRGKPTSRKVRVDGVLHGSILQATVYVKIFKLLVAAKEYSHLDAEVDYTLDCSGGQVGVHRIDIQGFDINKSVFRVYNIKPDFKESADELSKWKMRHWLRQYPTWTHPETGVIYPTRYEFYHCFVTGEGEVERVFFRDKDYLNNLMNK